MWPLFCQMKVSIILPVYNGEAFLEKALESILAQTYKNFELIVVDDGSTDRTKNILQKFKDKRIKLFYNRKRLGIGATLNKAISKASGIYLARADADDIMSPKRIETELRFLKNNSKVVAVGSWTKIIDSNGKIIGERKMPLDHKKITEMMFYAMGMQNPTVMFNRKLIPTNFHWCRTSIVIDDDLDLLFRLLPFGKFANIPKFLVNYRIHENNISLRNPKATFWEAQEIRKMAVKKYRYKPTFMAKILNSMEIILMMVAPNKVILPIYNLFRKVNS